MHVPWACTGCTCARICRRVVVGSYGEPAASKLAVRRKRLLLRLRLRLLPAALPLSPPLPSVPPLLPLPPLAAPASLLPPPRPPRPPPPRSSALPLSPCRDRRAAGWPTGLVDRSPTGLVARDAPPPPPLLTMPAALSSQPLAPCAWLQMLRSGAAPGSSIPSAGCMRLSSTRAQLGNKRSISRACTVHAGPPHSTRSRYGSIVTPDTPR